MKRIVLKIVTVIFMLTLINGYVSLDALAKTKRGPLSFGRIIYIDQNMGFVVINLGKEDGVEEAFSFEVYREDIKIGEIKTVKVRNKFSGADIESTYENKTIKVGDIVKPSGKSADIIRTQKKELLREEIDGLFVQAQEYFEEKGYVQTEEKIREILKLDPENKRALKMLSRVKRAKIDELFIQAQEHIQNYEYEEAEDKVCEILNLDPENKKALKMLTKVGQGLRSKFIRLKPDPITVDIDASKDTILSSAIRVFRENGCLITSSDPVKYDLQAFKNIKLSLAKAIITEWSPYTRNKIYYTVEITAAPKSNCLIIRLRGVYDKEGQLYDHGIRKDSQTYKEACEMALTIKDLAERL